MPPQGIETPSESVMLSMADEGAGIHFSARLCRYPAYRAAWIWAHVQTPDGFFAHVDHAAPCAREETPADETRAAYADAGFVLSFTREGASGALDAANVAVRIEAAASGSLQADMRFAPRLSRAGLLPGRVEAFGRVEGDLRVNGRTWRVRGMGQFHEQRQTEARFTTPFCFASLWGDGVGATLLQIPDDSGGYILRDGAPARPGRARFGPPNDPRQLRIDFGANEYIEGRATAVTRYTIPVYGQAWRGAFVTAELGGHRLHGALNDWRPELLFVQN